MMSDDYYVMQKLFIPQRLMASRYFYYRGYAYQNHRVGISLLLFWGGGGGGGGGGYAY